MYFWPLIGILHGKSISFYYDNTIHETYDINKRGWGQLKGNINGIERLSIRNNFNPSHIIQCN